MPVVENLFYANDNSNDRSLDIYYGDKERNGILLFYFHGGGIETGDKKDQKGLYNELVTMGYTIVSANYRMLPKAVFPEFVEDAAMAIAYGLKKVKEYTTYEKVVVGGISAGAYLSMMLHFNKEYLKANGVDEGIIDAYLFDAGQPTTHFNILKANGIDPGCVRIDEAAPLYYLCGEGKKDDRAFLVICSSNDIPGRKEQNELMIATMTTHGYNKDKICYQVVEGYGHAGYVDVVDENGKYPYAKRIDAFMKTI